MYPEFVAIYIMLIIIMGLLGVILFFLFKLMKNENAMGNNSYPQANNSYYEQPYQQQYQDPYQAQSGGVVFCKQCATQFDASQAFCPQCGTRR